MMSLDGLDRSLTGVLHGVATDTSGNKHEYYIELSSVAGPEGLAGKGKESFRTSVVTVLSENGDTWKRTVRADNELHAIINGCLFVCSFLGGSYNPGPADFDD
jgi:hypothetical protein